MTKMTYAQAIDNAINGILSEETVERLEALKVSLAKRNSGKRGMTKTQKENVEVIENIFNALGSEGVQCKAVAGSLGISVQKCSALLRQLVQAGRVEKYIEKGVTYFKVAEA